MDVKSKDYLDKIAEQANMEVIISATVARDNNNKDNIVKVDNFRLRRADIEIKVSYSTKEKDVLCATEYISFDEDLCLCRCPLAARRERNLQLN